MWKWGPVSPLGPREHLSIVEPTQVLALCWMWCTHAPCGLCAQPVPCMWSCMIRVTQPHHITCDICCVKNCGGFGSVQVESVTFSQHKLGIIGAGAELPWWHLHWEVAQIHAASLLAPAVIIVRTGTSAGGGKEPPFNWKCRLWHSEAALSHMRRAIIVPAVARLCCDGVAADMQQQNVGCQNILSARNVCVYKVGIVSSPEMMFIVPVSDVYWDFSD